MPKNKLQPFNDYSRGGAAIGEDASQWKTFAKTVGYPIWQEWTPTVANPSPTGTGLDRAMLLVHLLVWVFGLVLSGVAGCTVFSDGTGLWNGYGVSSTGSKILGVSGTISTAFGVVCILAACSCYTAKEYSQMIIFNTAIQCLTLYGTACAFFIFSETAAHPSKPVYIISLFGTIFLVYGQVLLYCTSATLGVRALPRSFIPAMSGAVQMVSAIAISNDAFTPSPITTYTDEQKLVAWTIPILTIIAVILMIFLREFTRDSKIVKDGVSISELHEYPFLRSVVLMPFMVSGILSVYKLSFVAVGSQPAAYIFAFFGMLLNFSIITVVFVPNGGAFGDDLLMVDQFKYEAQPSVRSESF